MNYCASNAEKYKGIYLITGVEQMNYHLFNERKVGCLYKEVRCPCCGELRFVRSSLLSSTNKNKMQSTLCSKCSPRTTQFFEKINNSYSRTYVNEHCVLVDNEDVESLRNFHFQIVNNNVVSLVSWFNNKRKIQSLHRFVLKAKENEVVDHINHNPLDCRKINLRIVNRKQNSTNLFCYKDNKSGFKNISLCNRNKKWFVQNKQLGITKRFVSFPEAYCFWKENIQNVQEEYAYNVLNDYKTPLRYSGIIKNDLANGNGIGLTFFTQGCSHHCYNCQNPQTWDFNGGKTFSKENFDEILQYFKDRPQANHLTLSGGEPLDSIRLTNFLISEFHYLFPMKKIWVYTGYNWEDIKDESEYLPLLETVDYIVDGEYVDSKRDLRLKWCGSTNQRVIDVKQSLKTKKIILYEGNQ